MLLVLLLIRKRRSIARPSTGRHGRRLCRLSLSLGLGSRSGRSRISSSQISLSSLLLLLLSLFRLLPLQPLLFLLLGNPFVSSFLLSLALSFGSSLLLRFCLLLLPLTLLALFAFFSFECLLLGLLNAFLLCLARLFFLSGLSLILAFDTVLFAFLTEFFFVRFLLGLQRSLNRRNT